MNKENCALKLVDETILYYDARSKKHQIIPRNSTYWKVNQVISCFLLCHTRIFLSVTVLNFLFMLLKPE